jgi:hypothetical protein
MTAILDQDVERHTDQRVTLLTAAVGAFVGDSTPRAGMHPYLLPTCIAMLSMPRAQAYRPTGAQQRSAACLGAGQGVPAVSRGRGAGRSGRGVAAEKGAPPLSHHPQFPHYRIPSCH